MVPGPIFDINERLKEDLINYFAAHKAKTIFRKSGNFLIFEPYLETEIFWSSTEAFKSVNGDILDEMVDMLYDAKKEVVNLGGQMTEPIFELHDGGIPVMVWALFETKPNLKIKIS